MVAYANSASFVWTIIVATGYHSHVAAHIDFDHHHSHEEGMHNHDHYHPGSASPPKIRGRMLTNDFFNVSSLTAKGRCGAHSPTPEMMAESSRVVKKWMASPNARQPTTIDVMTYFHIITADENLRTGETKTVGNITDTDVTNQLEVLNDSFRDYGFTFTLKGTTRTNNTEWYYFDEFGMKSALRVGDASTLNVYFSDAYGAGGYAYFPSDYELFPILDGAVLRSDTIPGGSYFLSGTTVGKILVHEVGHWLGLYHTFEGTFDTRPYLISIFGNFNRCRKNNDEVGDTPKQSSPSRGCPTGRNSCKMFPGSDPIRNYMDYSDDVCFNEFSAGQADRMKAMWNEYRAP